MSNGNSDEQVDGTRNRRRFLQLAAATSSIGLAGCETEGEFTPAAGDGSSNGTTVGTGTEMGSPAGSNAETIPLSEVDPQHLELAVRQISEGVLTGVPASREGEGWQPTGIADEVRQYFRPDVDGPAYLEFAVEPEGYVIVSTGRHDYPIPHWNHTGPSPSRMLDERADGELDTYYKMDSLYYVGEADSERLAERGYRIPRVEGLTEDMGQLQAVRAIEPVGSPEDDGAVEAGQESEIVEQSGPEELIEATGSIGEIELTEWGSWREMKAGYADAYQIQLGWLAEAASGDWEVHDAFAEKGRGLEVGTHQEPVAFEGTEWELSGEGAEYVEVGVGEEASPSTYPYYLTVEVAEPPEQLNLELHLRYPTGHEVTRRYAIGPEIRAPEATGPGAANIAGGLAGDWNGGGASNQAMSGSGAIDAVLGAAGGVADAAGVAGTTATGGWNQWQAGYPSDQCEYQQYNYQGCAVGCGPVAWAMLFGWADRQAESTNYWEPRFGIFREDVKESPAPNDVAPTSLNGDAQKMIELLNGHLNVYCLGGGGATNPWDMFDAYDFLRTRTGTGMRTYYSVPGAPVFEAKRRVARRIIDHDTPAILGTGVAPAHYPLAWAFAQKKTTNWLGNTTYHHSFYINGGWGDCCEGWVDGSTWFAGEIYP